MTEPKKPIAAKMQVNLHNNYNILKKNGPWHNSKTEFCHGTFQYEIERKLVEIIYLHFVVQSNERARRKIGHANLDPFKRGGKEDLI